MKKFLVSAATAGLLLGGAGLAHAQGPDATGPAKFGLCQAYSSGSQTGQDHKHNAPPFQNLAAAAAAQNQTVDQYCQGATPGGK